MTALNLGALEIFLKYQISYKRYKKIQRYKFVALELFQTLPSCTVFAKMKFFKIYASQIKWFLILSV